MVVAIFRLFQSPLEEERCKQIKENIQYLNLIYLEFFFIKQKIYLKKIIVFISLSFSQEDGQVREHPDYVVLDKKISIKEIIRFGGRRDESHGQMETPQGKKNRGYLLSQFLANASKAVTLRNDKTDNNTGVAIVCGTKIVTWTVCIFQRTIHYNYLD